jgi:hypothetical protein
MEAVKKVATQMDHAPASNPGVPHFISLLEFLEYCAAARQAAQQGQSYEEVARSDQGQLVQETVSQGRRVGRGLNLNTCT